MESEGDGVSFGSELRRLRHAADKSLAVLAKELGTGKGYLSRLERGLQRPSEPFARACDEVFQAGGALLALAVGPGTGVCPYPGLTSFRAQDARWFFGRDRAVADLLGLLADPSTAGHPAVVIGPSGIGKSSLLRAGLATAAGRGALPARHPGTPEVLYMTPTACPNLELRGHEERRALGTYAVLIVDQFEELFTMCADEAEREAFITALSGLAEGGLPVALGVRADFFGHCLAHPPLLAALRARALPLGPLSAAELRQVIVEPAAAEGLGVEPGLVELLLRDAGSGACEAGALPLLSHALRATWQHRADGLLTVAGYERTGGIHGAVAATAERVHAGLTGEQQRLARQVLLRLVQVGDGGQDTRRRLPRRELAEMDAETVVEAFTRARLLTAGEEHVEISHEALLRAWPRLREWIDTGRAGLRLRQRLADAAGVWDAEGRDPSLLLRGPRLTALGDWAQDAGGDHVLGPVERAFLEASREHDSAEREAVRRRHRDVRRLAGCLGVLLVIAAASAFTAVRKAGEVQREKRVSVAGQLSFEAGRLAGSRPEVSALLAAAAYRQAATAQTLSALMTAQAQGFARRLTGHEGPLRVAGFSADGRVVASSDYYGEALVWDPARGGRPHLLADFPHPLVAIAVSPDGRLVAAAGDQRGLWLWESGTGRLLAARTLRGMTAMGAMSFDHDGSVLVVGGTAGAELWRVGRDDGLSPVASPPWTEAEGVSFSPDGALVAGSLRDGTVRTWDRDARREGPVLRPSGAPVHDVAFSPDGTLLAASGDDGAVRLWRTSGWAEAGTLRGHQGTIWDVAFRADGRLLATGGEDQQVLLWDLRSRRQLATLSGHSGAVHSVDFPLRGTVLVSGSSDTTAALWDTKDWESEACAGGDAEAAAYGSGGLTTAGEGVVRYRTGERCRELRIDQGPVHGLARGGADDHLLAVGGPAGRVGLYDTRERPERPFTFDDSLKVGEQFGVAVSPGGTLLATAGNTNHVRVWDLSGHAARARLGDDWGAPGTVRALAFSPDDRILAVGADRGVTFRLLGRPAATEPAIATASRVTALRYSADGRRLAVGTEDGTVTLWDPVRHEEILTLATRQGSVRALWFAPDRRRIAITGRLRTTRWWTLDRDVALRQACAVADLPSPEEWRRLLPGVERAAASPEHCRRGVTASG
ncbi:helix-turn-helix domain-containing protein [Nonomuraea sp. NPDC050643]|uniref:nSTAND1 domain-containing NTPase n=1 Tax=Nonomuraea sp. NPDC050643 TaxID=3155660 RepID=UPI0033E8FD34